MRQCAQCGVEVPDGHTAKYCSAQCLQTNVETYWQKPRSARKQWYEPVPVRKQYERLDLVRQADRDMQRIAELEQWQ